MVDVARLVLAVLFAVAGAGKLFDLHGSREAARAFGVPNRLASPAGTLLPVAEVAIAGALLAPGTGRWGALGALLLLLALSAGVVTAILRGREVECHCFGKLGAARVGAPAVVRNAALSAVAGFAVIAGWSGPGHSAAGSVGALGLKHPLGAAAAVLGALIPLVIVRITSLGRRPEIGTRATQIPSNERLRTLDDRVVSLSTLRGDAKRTLLVFIDPACGSCRDVLPALRAAWDAIKDTNIVLITRGTPESNRDVAAGFPPDVVVIDAEASLADRLAVEGTPTAVLLAGSTAETAAVGAGEIQQLLSDAGDRLLGRHRPGLRRRARGGEPRNLQDGRRLVGLRYGRFTRRQVAMGGLGGIAAMMLPASATAAGARAARGGVRCPSCGKCRVCELKRGKKKVRCRPCKQKCSGRKLCASYANQLSDYRSIAAYLTGQGFVQRGEPQTLGLTQRGKLVFMGSYTAFASSSSQTPEAMLIYGLTNSGQYANAMLLTPQRRVAAVVTVNSSGQAVATALSSGSAAPDARSASESMSSPAASAAADYGCSDACQNLVGVFMAAKDVIFLEESALLGPLAPIALLGSFIASTTLSLAGHEQLSSTVSNAVSALVDGELTDSVAELAAKQIKSQTKDAFKDALLGEIWKNVCDYVCSWNLQACCSYGGGCWNSLATCAKDCPESLAHQAPCLVYLSRNGTQIYLTRF